MRARNFATGAAAAALAVGAYAVGVSQNATPATAQSHRPVARAQIIWLMLFTPLELRAARKASPSLTGR